MMKQSYNIVLVSLVALVLLAAFLLFLFRVQLFSYFKDQMDLANPLATTTITLAARDTIDADILKTKPFTTLVNYVVNFDFDNICFRPDTARNNLAVLAPENVAAIAATGTEATSTPAAPASFNCRQGNDLPFIVKTK